MAFLRVGPASLELFSWSILWVASSPKSIATRRCIFEQGAESWKNRAGKAKRTDQYDTGAEDFSRRVMLHTGGLFSICIKSLSAVL
eukprot:6483480-Amphidinium_carterae.1